MIAGACRIRSPTSVDLVHQFDAIRRGKAAVLRVDDLQQAERSPALSQLKQGLHLCELPVHGVDVVCTANGKFFPEPAAAVA